MVELRELEALEVMAQEEDLEIEEVREVALEMAAVALGWLVQVVHKLVA